MMMLFSQMTIHDEVIKWKHFLRNWPFVRGIHRSPVNSHHKGQWRGALMFSLICTWINGWVSNCEAGDMIRQRAHYEGIVMKLGESLYNLTSRGGPNKMCKLRHEVKTFRKKIKFWNLNSTRDTLSELVDTYDDVIKWKNFPRYWPFVRGIHRSLVNSPHKGQWRGALMFSLICILNKRLSK